VPRASRLSSARILAELRVAARKGDRTALTVAIDQMKMLALSPRYWEKYFHLLRNPLARLVDLLVIKQGERIARQKGWKLPRSAAPRASGKVDKPGKTSPGRRRPRPPSDNQPSLFEMEGPEMAFPTRRRSERPGGQSGRAAAPP